jgi:hypothetical protein
VTGREGVTLGAGFPCPAVAGLPTEPAIPPAASTKNRGYAFSWNSRFFLQVKTRAGDLAEVPLTTMPDLVMSAELPLEMAGVRFRVAGVVGYDGTELVFRLELPDSVFDGDTRQAYHVSRHAIREQEPDGYADGRPYWF